MKTINCMTTLCLILLLFALSTESSAAPTKSTATAGKIPPNAASLATWQKKWDDTVVAAKKEGELLIYLNAPAEARIVLQDAFKKKFGMTLNVVTGSGSVISSRLDTEYRSGIHLHSAGNFQPGGLAWSKTPYVR